jgi:class 3 adenylate cyclase/tetratricopeptide (TPR) repeat protein
LIFCRQCEAENPEGARFCEACGSAVDSRCVACGATNRVSARFCGQCGAVLAGSDMPSPKTVPTATSEIDPLSEGERKQVTVLFADVVGSTRLIEELDPETAMHRLEPAIQSMVKAVTRFGGVVNRMQGDGIMAMFGVPTACEGHAVGACLAAHAMIEAMAGLAEPHLEIRVGLDSGDVVVVPTGRDASDYDATGVTANLAHRIEQHAKPGTAVLSGRTARLARGYVDLAPLGNTTIRGSIESLELFQLLSANARPSWEVRSSIYTLNRFVGRETELAQLFAALGRAKLGRGKVVTVVADAGFGKSRLVHEFLHALPSGTWSILRVAAVEHAAGAPYYLAAELFRSWLGVEGVDDRAEVVRKLHQTLALIGMTGSTELASLQSLLDLPVDDVEWSGLAPSLRRNRMIATLRNLMLRESAVRPLVLLIDDYHWVDPASAEVLDAVVDGLGAAKLLMVVTTRPDRRPSWSGRSFCLELHLPPLEPESAEMLVRELIGDSAGLESLRQEVIAQAGGIPLFIEEIARSVAESGSVMFKAARHNETSAHSEVNVPPSVQTIIAARVDRLPPARHRLLQVASVIGKDIPLRLLRAVVNLPDDELERELAELQRAEFLYELNLPSGTEYTFRHVLMQTVVYEALLRKHRRDLHARVLGAIEKLFADRLDELTERLAGHALRGEIWDAAASYALKAGDRAIARWAWREAIIFFDSAIEALAHLSDGPDKVSRSIEARLRLRVALPAAAELPRWLRCLDEARELASASEDARRLAEIDTGKCIALTKMGQLAEAIEAGREGYNAAARLRVPGAFLNASFALAQAYWYYGEFAQSEELLANCVHDVLGELRLANTGTTGTASVLHLVCLSKTYAITGKFAKALATIEEARWIAEQTRKPFDISYARVGKGFCLLVQGKPLDAVMELEEALYLARGGDIALLIPSSMRYLGRAYALTGRLDEARGLLQEAIERTTAQGLLGMRLWSCGALALVQMRASAMTEAGKTLFGTLELARKHGFRPLEAFLMRLIGNLQRSNGEQQLGAAESWYRRAIALADKLGMNPEAAHARRDFAMFLRRTGRSQEAAVEETAAHELRRSMGLIGTTLDEETGKASSRIASQS